MREVCYGIEPYECGRQYAHQPHYADESPFKGMWTLGIILGLALVALCGFVMFVVTS